MMDHRQKLRNQGSQHKPGIRDAIWRILAIFRGCQVRLKIYFVGVKSYLFSLIITKLMSYVTVKYGY